MTEDRRFPPSPRRRALARQAGVTAASPTVVAAAAAIGALLAIAALARAATARLGDAIAAACAGRASLAPGDAPAAVLAFAAPLCAAAAIAAIAAQLAQARGAWLPRRRIRGAPAVRPSAARRLLELAAPAAIGGVALGWLWLVAPRLASLVELSGATALAATAALLASLLAALASALVALGAVDALVRRGELARALAMTAAEKREDDRLAAADPRWRARRAELARAPSLAGAAAIVLGDDLVIAIAWDPARQPIPSRIAAGHGTEARRLLGLARRHDLPVHRDPGLAAALDGLGPVPEAVWPRLAEVIAAVRGRPPRDAEREP
ncbi:MAG TPA: EscU/YscU/HrcU family type III secretion system export apparatus switch protein [Kofleriaceae bacterium]|nr:EscU/YscU/HrcU family type III secretion system export apparatus switch protein [Kofleriaceae bacterium]